MAEVAEQLAVWVTSPEGWPVKLLWLLEHRYTQASLSFAGLKGADAAAAAVLLDAGQQAGVSVHLAMLSIQESGSAMPRGGGRYGRRRYGRHDEEEDEEDQDFEVTDVTDRCQELTNWQSPDDTPPPVRTLPFEGEDLLPANVLEGIAPDEQSFSEATGNEGGTFERAWRRAALVLWPRLHADAVLAQREPDLTVPWLEAAAAAWVDGDLASPARARAMRIAEQVVRRWPTSHRIFGTTEQHARVLRVLVKLRADDAIEPFEPFGREVVSWLWHPSDADEALVAAFVHLGQSRAEPLLRSLIERHHRRPRECIALIERLSVPMPQMGPLFARLYVDGIRGDVYPEWIVRELRDLLGVLWPIGDGQLAEAAIAHALERFEIDRVLVPLATSLAADKHAGQGFERLRSAVIAHLTARLHSGAASPENLSQPADWDCTCEGCVSLRAFLASPTERTWSLKGAAPRRQHIEAQIERLGIDVETRVLRQGSPHTLVCTKSRRTQQRKADQRKADLDALTALGARPG